jgi:hypothetical protein
MVPPLHAVALVGRVRSGSARRSIRVMAITLVFEYACFK